jgi:hypothetical protein
MGMRGRNAILGTLVAALAVAPSAGAQVPPVPIPDLPSGEPPASIGAAVEAKPVDAPDPPRHPFMAPNGRSNLHEDAYQTDVHQGPAPLGPDLDVVSTLLEGVCASVTFDSRGRIVTICVGAEGPKLVMLDAGGYFYLDDRDRAVIPTTTRQLLVVEALDPPGFRLAAVHDLNQHVRAPDKVFAAMPDWSGRIWFVSAAGVVGNVDPATGAVRSHQTGEEISNSFAVDESGGVYVVTAKALYRFDAGASGAPAVSWREQYDNSGIAKPGQVHAGSGTTPTVMGTDRVAIADNADPMNVVVYRRGRTVDGAREVCRAPVFDQGTSATDQSLIATPDAIVAENNYGYTGPAAVMDGRTTTPGLQRVDVSPDGVCTTRWRSSEVAPSVVPKLGAATGLVYTYTKPGGDPDDPWYLTAIDFESGETRWKRLAGTGLGYNNNYAPITIGPDGTTYVGALGGLVALR